MSAETSKEHEEYNNVVRVAELRQIVLISSNFELNTKNLSDEDYQLSRSEDICGFAFKPEGDGALLEIEYVAKASGEKGEFFSIKARYAVAFYFDEKVDIEAAEKVVTRIGRFAAYPYFRRHVAQISWESGLDFPPLPIIKQNHEFKVPVK